MKVCHFNKVDLPNISEHFTSDGKHRSLLDIPLLNRPDGKTICIIGQNPSEANSKYADKTIHYLERYVYEKMPSYSRIMMLNLYSRLDTDKSATTDLLRFECEWVLRRIVRANTEFLIVFGQLKNQRAYKFPKKEELLKKNMKGKNVYKIDIGSSYAPHPGNKAICYGNYCYGITTHIL